MTVSKNPISDLLIENVRTHQTDSLVRQEFETRTWLLLNSGPHLLRQGQTDGERAVRPSLYGKTKKGLDKGDKVQKSNNSIHTYIHTYIHKYKKKATIRIFIKKTHIKGKQNKVFKKVIPKVEAANTTSSRRTTFKSFPAIRLAVGYTCVMCP